jgi:transforming growth factor-beta-induced protein
MLLFKVFAGLASLVSLAVADDAPQPLPMDLGSVLSRHPKLSTYYKLIQV